MSELYPDLPNTKFPEDKDNWGRFSDITTSDIQLVQQYQQYILDGEIDNARQLITDNPTLKNKILSANNLNNLADAIIALERYYFSDIETYIIQLSRYMGDWNNQTSYRKYDVVIYDELGYFATKSVPYGEYPTNDEYWVPLTLKGDQGVSGVGLSYRYGWDINTQYYEQDCVSYSNSLWAAKQSSIGQTPVENSQYWDLVMKDSNACVVDIVSQEPPDLISGQLWAKKLSDEETGSDVGVELTVKDANGGKTLLPKTNSDYVDVKNGDYTSSLTSMLNSVKTNITNISKDLSGLRNSLNSEGQSAGNIPVWNGTAFESGAPLESITQPNILINSDFAINQRGKTSYSTINQYTYDRWFLASAKSVTRQTNTCPDSSTQYMLNISVKNNSANSFCQPMENFSDRFVGKTVTVSFYVKAATSGSLICGFGNNRHTFQATTSWQKVVLTIPSVSAWPSGTWYLNGFYLQTPFGETSGAIGNYSITGVQVVYGDYAGQYIPPDPATELVKCQRFYQTNDNDTSQRALIPVNSSGFAYGFVAFPVTMRVVPNMSYTSPNDVTGLAGATNGIDVNKGGLTSNGSMDIRYKADAEIYS